MAPFENRTDLLTGRSAWIAAALFPLAELGAMLLGKYFHFSEANASTLWCANAVLLGAMLLLPARLWWVLIVGTLAAQFGADAIAQRAGSIFPEPQPWFLAATAINILEALVPAIVLRRIYPGAVPVWRVRGLVAMLIIAGVFSCALSALLGATLVTSLVDSARFWQVWNVWWLSDGLGVVLFTTLILTFVPGVRIPRQYRSARRRIEGIFAGLATTLAAVVVSAGTTGEARSVLDFPYFIFVLLLVMSMRYDIRTLFWTMLAVALATLASFDHGGGMFLLFPGSAYERVLAVQLFLILALVPTQLLAVRTAERQLAMDALQREISTRRHAQTAQRVVIDELDHRVRNSLANIVALIDLTSASAADVKDLSSGLSRRVSAMARVHDTLSASGYGSVRLSDVLIGSLSSAIGPIPRSVTIQSEDLWIPAAACPGLTLAISELASNCKRHGALSEQHAATGHVRIAWRLDGPTLALEWTERWQPTHDDPDRPVIVEGVGIALAKGMVMHELHGGLDIHAADHGIDAHLRARVRDGHLSAKGPERLQPSRTPRV